MDQFSLIPWVTVVTLLSTPVIGADCNVKSYDSVQTAVSDCTNIVIDGITVPGGKVLALDLKEGSYVHFKGNIKFENHGWAGPLVVISGKNVFVNGDQATLDGQGENYWDGKESSGTEKPKFFEIRTTEGSRLQNIKLLNCPRECVLINNAKNTFLRNFTIDVTAGNENANNTDGFVVANAISVNVQDSMVKNQGNCVAVKQGFNMNFRGLTCIGGHGLTVSVGERSEHGGKNMLKNIAFTDCSVYNSYDGITVRTHTDGGNGSIHDLVYKNIKLLGISNYGINIQQDYKEGKSTGDPKGNIHIHNLILNNVRGSMNGGPNATAVNILCGSGGCKNWQWFGVSIYNGVKANQCNFTPDDFKC